MIGPRVTHRLPATGLIRYWFARIVCTLARWDIVGEPPQITKAVLIAAPHTSNWDLVWAVGAAWVFRVRVQFVAKKSLFRWPFGGLMRSLGLIAIDRSGNLGLVGQLAKIFEDSEAMCLAVAPSGTRSLREHWKSGFYWIAKEAGVPIVCAFVDFEHKRAGLGPAFEPSEDLSSDMDLVRAFYADIGARYPENKTPVRLREETA